MIKTMKKNKTFYTIAAFSWSKVSKSNRIIGSIQYRYDVFEDINWTDLAINNKIFRNNKTLEIYNIFKDPEFTKLEPMNETIYQTLDNKFEKNETIELYDIPDHYFFTKSFIDENIFNLNVSLSSRIFIFEDSHWKFLVNRFKDLDIILSGGSNVKRHHLSPVHMKLSRLLLVLEGNHKSFNRTINSYDMESLIQGFNNIKNFSKNEDIWELRNALKNLEKYKTKGDEIDFRLFLLNKYNPENIKYFACNIVKSNNNIGLSIDELADEIFNVNLDGGGMFDPKIEPHFKEKLEYFDQKYHFKK